LWFESYLSNCLQFVEIKETDCSNSVISHHARNWSMVCCLLSSRATFIFVIYINDITENLQEAKMVSSADDTNVLITRKDEST
jgi:hypothetical protein